MAIIKINLFIESILSKDELLNKIKNIGKNPTKRPTLLFNENQYDVNLNENYFSIKQKPFYETIKGSAMAGTAMAEVSGKIDQYKDKSKIKIKIDFSNSLIIFNAVIVPLITFFWLINPEAPIVMTILLPFAFYITSIIYIICVKKYWIKFFSADIKATSKNNRILLKNIIALAIFNFVISIVFFVISFFKDSLNEIFIPNDKILIIIGIAAFNFLAGFLTFLCNSLYLKMNLLDIFKRFSLKLKIILFVFFSNAIFHLVCDPNPIILARDVIIRNSQWRALSSILLFLNFLFMSILFECEKIIKVEESKK